MATQAWSNDAEAIRISRKIAEAFEQDEDVCNDIIKDGRTVLFVEKEIKKLSITFYATYEIIDDGAIETNIIACPLCWNTNRISLHYKLHS